jgi:hypothetical protein
MKPMKPMKSFLNYVLIGSFAFGSFALMGCSTDSTPKMGAFEVKMHDAPASYDEVNVFVTEVQVNNTTGDQGWVTISEPNQSYNLLELTNGAFAVLADTELEVGTYRQIRLILSRDENSVVIDGVEHGLFIPSGSQTGIKLNIDAVISEGIQYTLLLDFDVLRSVVRAGPPQTNNFLLKPVIRATNQALTGNIGGTISPAESKPVIYAINDSDTLSTTYANVETGEFLLVGLPAGAYTVSVEATEEGYVSTSLSDVEVVVGQTTDLEVIELDTE